MNAIEQAISNMKAKNYRKTKSGKFEIVLSEHSKTLNLGTYSSEKEADDVARSYRIDRLTKAIELNGDDPNSCKPYGNNYLVTASGHIYNLHGHEMQGCIGRDGYKHVILNAKNYDYHRVVADAFLPKDPDKPQVNHINGIKTDNRIENLERCTRSENLRHAYELGLEIAKSGENHPKHKLTQALVDEIRSTYKKKSRTAGFTALARKYGVDKSTIAAAALGKTWRSKND